MKPQNIARKAYTILALIFITSFTLFPALSQEKSLYERLGGVNAIASVVDDFVDKLLADPAIVANKNVVVSLKNITTPGLKYLLTEMICEAAGGPQKYTGRTMKESHAHLNITESEWQAMEKDFLASLKQFNVPEKEQNELVTIVRSTKKDIVLAKEAPPPAPPPEAQKAPPPEAPVAPPPQAPVAPPEAQKAAPPEAPVAPPQPPPAPQTDNDDEEEDIDDEDIDEEDLDIDSEIFNDDDSGE